MHTHADTHIYAQTSQAHADPHLHTDLHTQMCTRTKTHTQACVHKSAQAHIDMCTDTQTPQGPSKHAHDLMHTNVHTDRLTHKDTGADPSHTPPHRNTITEPPRRPLPTTQTHTCRNAHARTHTIAHTHRLLTTETHTHMCWSSQTLPKQTCTHIPVPAWPSPQLEQAAWAGSAAYSSTKDPFPKRRSWIGTRPRAIVPTMPLCKSAPAAPLCPPSYPGS